MTITIQTKFNIKDTVYFLHNNHIKKSIVHSISVYLNNNEHIRISYFVSEGTECFSESDVFASQDDLINSIRLDE